VPASAATRAPAPLGCADTAAAPRRAPTVSAQPMTGPRARDGATVSARIPQLAERRCSCYGASKSVILRSRGCGIARSRGCGIAESREASAFAYAPEKLSSKIGRPGPLHALCPQLLRCPRGAGLPTTTAPALARRIRSRVESHFFCSLPIHPMCPLGRPWRLLRVQLPPVWVTWGARVRATHTPGSAQPSPPARPPGSTALLKALHCGLA
jgi:hypothetical protein